MKRVYLAKSNRANPDLVSLVRQTLSKFDVEVVEFTGGTYSHDLLMSCDEIIAIPDLTTLKRCNISKFTTIALGKGLWEQIATTYECGKPVFIITDYDDNVGIGGVFFDDDDDNFYSLDLSDENDYTEYGYFCVNEKNADLVGWELYDFMLDGTSLKDKTWINGVMAEINDDYKTWKGNDTIQNWERKANNKKFMVLLAKK